MRGLKTALVFAVVAAVSVGMTPVTAEAKGHVRAHKAKLVVWKKGKPGKCGANWYWNKKKRMCHDARWK